MIRTATLAACALGLMGFPATSTAQTPGGEPAVVELPSSTRAMGLGHAFQAGPDPDGVFYNPALASRARGFALGVHMLTSAARGYTVSAATPWLGGGVAVGLQAMEYGADHGLGQRAGGVDPILADGGTGVSEMAATLAYGRDVFGIRTGLSGRLLDQRFGPVRRQALVLDVGLAHSLGPGTLALAARHLGGEEDGAAGRSDPPTDVTLGWSAWGQPVGPLDLGVATSVTRREDGEVLYGGGIELGYWPVRGRTFVVRMGGVSVPEGEASPLTFGGSFWGDALVLDYAFQPVDGTDGVHRVTVGWR